MTRPFRAYMVEKEPEFTTTFKELSMDALPPGDVTIRVEYSSVNFKDGLASVPDGRVVRRYPMIPGIDLAGVVAESVSPKFREGDPVLITGYDLGIAHYGGYSEYARVPADWVVPLPKGLTAKESMIIGTAGFTAALSIHHMEQNGLAPGRGPVLVTGATGGVGSIAINILAKLGYTVAASTGKTSSHDYLTLLGAQSILSRQEVSEPSNRPLEKERWAGAVDPVGGNTLAYIARTLQYGGSVALCGLTGGTGITTTVFPFILRAANLLGIDSVFCPQDLRHHLWNRLATDMKPPRLHEIMTREISLETLPENLGAILRGEIQGRIVVRI